MIYMLPTLLHPGVLHFADQDTAFHLSRIQGLSNAFSKPVNFNNFNHHGTIINVCYPWITIYPAYIIYKLFGSLVAGYKLFYLLITIITMLTAYFSMYQIKKSEITALLFSLFYTFATYRSTDIFKRAAMGESVALTFFPLILLGCYYLMKDDYKKWYILTIGMSLVLYSHLLSVAMITFIIAFFIITTFYFWDHKLERIKYFALATGMTVLTSIGVIIPLLEQSKYTPLKIPTGNQLNGIERKSLWLNTINSNVFSYGIGLILLVGIAWTFIVVFGKKKKLYLLDKYIFVVGVVIFILMGDYIPWHLLNNTPIVSLQFVFRITCFVNLFIAYGFALAFTPKKQSFSIILFLLIFIGAIHLNSINNLYKTAQNQQTIWNRSNIETTTANYDHTDYANKESIGKPQVHQQLFIANDKTTIKPSKNTWTDNVYTIKINNSLGKKIQLSMPIYRYKGQIVKVNGENKRTNLSKFGTTEVSIPKGKSTITITYRFTKLVTISHIISFVSFFLLIILSYKNTVLYKISNQYFTTSHHTKSG